MKKYMTLLLGLIVCASLTHCGGGSDDNQSTFTMTAQSFLKSRKDFLFQSSGGYVRIIPRGDGWYYTSLGPDTDATVKDGVVECTCLICYAPDETGFVPSEGVPGSARYYVTKDGVANLELNANSNSGSIGNVAAVLLGMLNVDGANGNVHIMHVSTELVFSGEDAGSWYSSGYVDTTGNYFHGYFRLYR